MSAKLDFLGTASMRSTLESAALPRRVHGALEHLYALLSDELERQLERMLSDFEQQLFRLAEQARNAGEQSRHFETLRRIRQNRADLVPRYLAAAGGVEAIGGDDRIEPARRPFEYMLNVLRLVEGFALTDFEARTGLPRSAIEGALRQAYARGWLEREGERIRPTELGRRFTNDVMTLFLDTAEASSPGTARAV